VHPNIHVASAPLHAASAQGSYKVGDLLDSLRQRYGEKADIPMINRCAKCNECSSKMQII
jgi:hypothetical protein